MKKIVIIIDRPPCDGVAETLRMTAGLTLEDDNKPVVLFVGDGERNLDTAEDGPYVAAIAKHREMLGMMQVPLVVGSAAEPSLLADADMVICG